MIVMKFGGTSVGSSQQIKKTSEIIISRKVKNPIVVVSAVSGITNELLRLANLSRTESLTSIDTIKSRHQEILSQLNLSINLLDSEFKEIEDSLFIISKLKDDSKMITDLISSFGERMSVKILSNYLTSIGFNSKPFNAYDLGMITDDNFGFSEPLLESYSLIKENISKIDKNIIPIITGFIGKNKKGQITTLSRGGSDYTAAIIGAAIDAKKIEIWTDVNGILTANPKIVSNAKNINSISFQEAAELSTFGAKVLHPKTIQPAIKKNIPIYILNSFNPLENGSVIENNSLENRITAISCKKDIVVLKVKSTRMLHTYGFLSKLFEIFNDLKLSIDLIATSEISVSLIFDEISQNQIDVLSEKISSFGEISFIKDKSIISVVGKKLSNEEGLISKIVSILSNKKITIDLISYGASEININLVVSQSLVDEAIVELHKNLFD